jgi:hypothetical protein
MRYGSVRRIRGRNATRNGIREGAKSRRGGMRCKADKIAYLRNARVEHPVLTERLLPQAGKERFERGK